MYQLLMLPLIAPERITNSNTRMLTAVKTLFTMADSLTPKARIPRRQREYQGHHYSENKETLLNHI